MLTQPPVDPVLLVREICLDTLAGNKRTRWAQRFTPIQSTCYATLPEFRGMCDKVLSPIFHGENVSPIKVLSLLKKFHANEYAVRPNARDNQVMIRDTVIHIVGAVIGRNHPVDLKNYDVLILVETVKAVLFLTVFTLEHHRHQRCS